MAAGSSGERYLRQAIRTRSPISFVAAIRAVHKLAVLVLAVVLLSVTMLAAGCGGAEGTEADDAEIVVMAASSLSEVMDAVATQRPAVTPVLAGSSTLVAQLEAGAAADVLITADWATMSRAVDVGAVAGTPVAIATNRLVLATAPGNPAGVAALSDLGREELVVGLCADEVPCGALAHSGLDAAGVEPSVDTLELNVRALTTKLALGELDAGLIYSTDAAAAQLPTVDVTQLREHVNRYYIVAVDAPPSTAAQALIDDFATPGSSAADALRSHGFGEP